MIAWIFDAHAVIVAVVFVFAWLIPRLNRAEAQRTPTPVRVVPGRFIAYPVSGSGHPTVAPWEARPFSAPSLDAAAERVCAVNTCLPASCRCPCASRR